MGLSRIWNALACMTPEDARCSRNGWYRLLISTLTVRHLQSLALCLCLCLVRSVSSASYVSSYLSHYRKHGQSDLSLFIFCSLSLSLTVCLSCSVCLFSSTTCMMHIQSINIYTDMYRNDKNVSCRRPNVYRLACRWADALHNAHCTCTRGTARWTGRQI